MVYCVESLSKVYEDNCIDKVAVQVQTPAICGFDQYSNCTVDSAKTTF